MNSFRPKPAILATYGALLVLLAATLALTLLPGGWLATGLHAALAVAMGALIVAVYMGVRAAAPLMKVFALGGLLWLLFLLALTPLDYLTRAAGG